MADDDEEKPPSIRLMSDNPIARVDRKLVYGKQEVERTIALFAAALLRTMAGSDTEAMFLMQRLSDFIDALNAFRDDAGRNLTIAELEQALRLPQIEYESSTEEWRHRQWIRKDGFDTIVKGALRLAAHRILDEKPHFGGKYSEEVIEAGIKTLEELKRPPANTPSFRHKKAVTAGVAPRIDLGPPPKGAGAEKSSGRKKRTAGFSADDLKELRKAIRARDEKKITELRTKLGKPPTEN